MVGGGVVVVCYGEEERAKAELLMGREAGAGVVVQAMGALLQSIRQREQTATVNGKAEVVQAEEKREAEEDEQQQQRTSPPSHPHQHHHAAANIASPSPPSASLTAH